MNKEFSQNVGVFIGRFQPFHNGHLSVIENHKDKFDYILILVGSTLSGQDTKNPFSFSDVYNDIYRSLSLIDEKYEKYVDILELPDIPYDDKSWIESVNNLIDRYVKIARDKVTLIGMDKDESSYYLDKFPRYKKSIEDINDSTKHINATDIRKSLFEEESPLEISSKTPYLVGNRLLNEYRKSKEFKRLKREYEYIHEYKKEVMEYKPILQTVDCVLQCQGKILLIKRKSKTGDGLFAMPGGFLEYNETLWNGCKREVLEETGIDLNKGYILQEPTFNHVFDCPSRSSLHRTITTVFHVDISAHHIPEVKCGSDAASGQWILIDDIIKDRSFSKKLYQDHYTIINKVLENYES